MVWASLFLSILINNIHVILLKESLLLLIRLTVSTISLDRSESSSNLSITVNASSSTRWDHTDLPSSLLLLSLHLMAHLLRSLSSNTDLVLITSLCCRREEAFALTAFVILCIIKGRVFVLVMRVYGRCGHSSDTSCMCGVWILSLNWLRDGIVKVDDQILIDCIFIWGFWSFLWLPVNASLIVASSLSSSMVSSDSFILWRVLRNAIFHWRWSLRVLDCLVVVGCISAFGGGWIIAIEIYLSSIFDLLSMNRSSHVQILLRCNNMRLWWLILRHPFTGDDSFISGRVNGHSIFTSGWIGTKSHLLFEIYFRLLIWFLSVFNLLVSFVDQMVASSDMVVTVIFNTFFSVLVIKFVLLKNFLIEFIINRHLFSLRD